MCTGRSPADHEGQYPHVYLPPHSSLRTGSVRAIEINARGHTSSSSVNSTLSASRLTASAREASGGEKKCFRFAIPATCAWWKVPSESVESCTMTGPSSTLSAGLGSERTEGECVSGMAGETRRPWMGGQSPTGRRIRAIYMRVR